jgi:hypothetical protein
MRPIAEFLLQAGISFREFENVSRLAFAETAMKKYGVRGRHTNISRVAVMTGISRKEIAKLREQLLSEKNVDSVSTSPSSLVLAGWHTDRDFMTEDGKPLPIPYDGQGMTFVELVKRYAGDVPAGAVRVELKRSNIIEESDNGLIHPLGRHFVPHEALDRLATSVEFLLGGLAATIAHNTDPNRADSGFIERLVYSDRLRESAVLDFRQVARERAQSLLEGLDDWLAANDVLVDSATDQAADRRVGLGVFYYEGPKSDSSRTDE